MAAIYLGGGTVRQAVPGLAADFDEVGAALQGLKDVVEIQIARLVDIAAALGTNATATATAKTAIRIPATADFQAQLDAALSVSASFAVQLSNPAAYLQTLLDGLTTVQASLALQVPTVALNAQIAASASSATLFDAKIAAVDAELDVLTNISVALAGLAEIANEVIAALRAAISAVLGALRSYLDMADQLLATGVHSFLYDGPLSGLGAAIDAVAPSAGISAPVAVRVPVVIVEDSNLLGRQGVNSVFRVS